MALQVNPFAQRIWQLPTQDYGIDKSEQEKIERFLKDRESLCADRTPQEHDEFLQSLEEDFKQLKIDIYPRFVSGDGDKGTKRIVEISLSANLELGFTRSGGAVYKVYNLTQGRVCVQKEAKRKEEIAILTLLSKQTTPIEGIYQVYQLIPIKDGYLSMGRAYSWDLYNYYTMKKKSFNLSKEKIFEQLSSGLAYLHQQGVFHADLKPQNVLVEPDGAVIADFDVSNRLDIIGGTPRYMSPGKLDMYLKCKNKELKEDAITDYNKEFSKPDDIWSLGLISFFVLNGPYKKGSVLREVAPLKHIETYRKKYRKDQKEFISHCSQVTKAEVQEGIELVRKKLKDKPELLEVCQVAEEMLDLDPKKRPDAKDIQERINQALKPKA